MKSNFKPKGGPTYVHEPPRKKLHGTYKVNIIYFDTHTHTIYIYIATKEHHIMKAYKSLPSHILIDIPWFHGIINTFSLSLVCPKALFVLILI